MSQISPIAGLTIKQLLAIVIPIAAIQAGFIAAALVNLKNQNPDNLRGSKKMWSSILIISLFTIPLGMLSPILYFTAGRK